jgi:predicted enzyme related to lactoylglutathione lyase
MSKSIHYIEFPMTNFDETKAFYAQVFGWEMNVISPNYIGFTAGDIQGGFNGHNKNITSPGIMLVLHADDLPQKLNDVKAAGGEILKPIYDIPGGQRFNFKDPNGTEMSVASPSAP